MNPIILSAILVSGMVSFTSTASGILTERNLSLELADKLAQRTIQSCSASNYNVAITVVDRAGIFLVIKKWIAQAPIRLKPVS